jgi:hypothetical protein
MNARRYQALYCEENIWWLAAEDRFAAQERWVTFISNRNKQVALRHQRAAGDEPVIVWDYHVVLLVRDEQMQVWDLDTTLPLPCALARYLAETFPPVGDGFAPRFRLVPPRVFRETFASDRRHMVAPDGSWQHQPPPWPAIGEGHNLMRFVDVDDDIAGEVLTLDGLVDFATA